MQIDLEAVGDRVVVDARGQAAGADQRFAVEAAPLGHGAQFVGRVARVPPAAAADVQTEFVGPRIEAALERPQHRRRDARRVPVHPHDAAQRLEPERIAQPGQQLGRAVVKQTLSDDRRAERGHPLREPRRHAPAMQRQIGDARAFHLLQDRVGA